MGLSDRSLVGLAAIVLLTPLCTGNSDGSARYSGSTTVVIGSVTCDGCFERQLDRRPALLGSSVAIKCKTGRNVISTVGMGSVDENGSFSVKLPSSAFNDNGELGSQCFAMLTSGNEKSPPLLRAPPEPKLLPKPKVFRFKPFLESIFSSKSKILKRKPLGRVKF